MDKKRIAINEIDSKQDIIIKVANSIWEYAELSLKEHRSCDLYVDILKKEGFSVEENFCGIPTAFAASFGKGKPIIGILAEYDALSALSQKKGETEKLLDESCVNGHGCGHNLLGAGAYAAALGIKAYLENKDSGTVILYGCPGEEGWASKAYMAREGVWQSLDAALTWHPEDCNEVVTGSSNSCLQYLYEFSGVASHASGAPELGRSALDAVELMNIGVQFIREHMGDGERVHYSIIDAGGTSPNVVQAKASVLYMVRSEKISNAIKLQERVDKIAQGAALMTETSMTKRFVDGLSDTVVNRTLETVLYRNFEQLGVPDYDSQELEFAKELSKTYESNNNVPGLGSIADWDYAQKVKTMCSLSGMNDVLLPHFKGSVFRPGSTDVGDVSHNCPTAQIHVAAWPNGCPGHSWQNVSSAGTSIGHKAAICAGKVLAAAAVELYENREILEEARAEFDKRTVENPYICPFPREARPELPEQLLKN